MKFPAAVQIRREEIPIRQFYGLNRRAVILPSQAADMQNLSARQSPAAATRARRTVLERISGFHGMTGGENLVTARGTGLYVNGEKVASVSDTDKTFAVMGSRVLVFPDKICYDRAKGTVESLEAEYSSTGTVTFSLSALNGTEYAYEAADTAPKNPADGAYWVDTSGERDVLRRYSRQTDEWIGMASSYIKISAKGIGKNFAMYDGVELSGCVQSGWNTQILLYEVQEDAILVSGSLRENFSQTEPISLTRKVPDITHPVVYGNRLWGYDEKERTIRGSKLGDPKNFSCFMGLSTDSYAVECAAQGACTGAEVILGRPVFFTETEIMTLYGTKPSDFALSVTEAAGIAAGCEKSAAVLNGVLYYVGRHGIYAYRGALPERISEALGDWKIRQAAGGGLQEAYYLSGRTQEGSPLTLVYDTAAGIWHKQDAKRFTDFAETDGCLLGADESGTLWSLNEEIPTEFAGAACVREDPFAWYWETGDLFCAVQEQMTAVKVQLSAEFSGKLTVEASWDGGEFHSIGHKEYGSGFEKMTFSLPHRRAGRLKLRIGGQGDAILYALSLEGIRGTEVQNG